MITRIAKRIARFSFGILPISATDKFLHLETHLKLIKAEATKRKLKRPLNIHAEVSLAFDN